MVVDDSAVIRGIISRWLTEADGIHVAGTAPNGRQAVDKLKALDPDVVVLDIEMPEMDGLTALPLMLKQKPGLIVIMASTLTRRNADISLKALSLGASDYVPKPEGNSGVTTSVDFRREIVEKIKALGRRAQSRSNRSPRAEATAQDTARRISERMAARKESPAAASKVLALRQASRVVPRILVIGSSTGGPPALAKVVTGLGPALARLPVLITQHMPPTFTSILAEHLAKASGVSSAEAEHGEAITAGRIYVAPGGRHMVIGGTNTAPKIRLTDDPPVNFCRPAVDPLFESASRVFGPAVLACVLTGMGHDGAAGGLIIADAGGTVVAQDEETSVVWGMPGATAQNGCCAAVLPLDRIASKLQAYIGGTAR